MGRKDWRHIKQRAFQVIQKKLTAPVILAAIIMLKMLTCVKDKILLSNIKYVKWH